MGRRIHDMDDIHAPTVSSGPTTAPSTNGTSHPLTLSQLSARKDNIEAELSALGSVLDSHNVTMTTPLTTPDGFPRADLDVAQIRTTRARIIRLKNDYKGVMKLVEKAVEEAFASGKGAEVANVNGTARVNGNADSVRAEVGSGGNSAGRQASAVAAAVPFAKVNAVVEGSPAATAGMRVGDKVTKFGEADWMNHERLGKVARVVQENENRAIVVKVLRETSAGAASQNVELSLTPRRNWGGRGLLGCHLLPV